jgi:large subunit ribosomal protein L9
MKVILLENLRRIGSIGEIIDVKRGFARNFLISNKKALYASKENIAEVEKIKSELSKKDTEKNKELYGSVKPTEISKLILENDKLDIKPSMIQPITEIKSIGKFKVKIILHSEVDSEITINVVTADTIQ